MNYRHAFHAGNFADVFKHVVLIGLLDALKAKPASFCYFDTHAGRGGYDLRTVEAGRTLEYREGVRRVVDADRLPVALEAYATLVRSFNPKPTAPLTQYPGSPLIAQHLLRECDRAILCEWQPDEAAVLHRGLRGDTRFGIHRRDGYEALKALLPPTQKRGLVLIDPPYEAQAAEFVCIESALLRALNRWPNAMYAIWYPVKLREAIIPFHRWLHANAGSSDVLIAELLLHADTSPLRLNGCGMAIVNPPWRFDRWIQAWLPFARNLLAPDSASSHRVDWLHST